MNAHSLHAPSPTPNLPAWIWAALSFGLALVVQLAGVVAWGATVETRVDEVQATTEPLRRGDLVKIQTDVTWIRERLEAEERE